MDKASVFWEKALLNNLVQKHVLVPTLMYAQPTETNLATQDEAKQYHSECCECGKNILDTTVACGFRCMFAKIDTLYLSAFMSVHFCETCSVNRKIACIMNSDHDMINRVLDRLEEEAHDLSESLRHVDIHIDHFFDCLMLRMRSSHVSMLKEISQGTSDNCTHCEKKDARGRCSGCYFMKYCNAKCAQKDWKNHKKECKWLKSISIFMMPQYHLKIK